MLTLVDVWIIMKIPILRDSESIRVERRGIDRLCISKY